MQACKRLCKGNARKWHQTACDATVPLGPLTCLLRAVHRAPSSSSDTEHKSYGFSPEDLGLEHLDEPLAAINSGNNSFPSCAVPATPTGRHGSQSTEARPALTHLDDQAMAHMVDVGQKAATRRTATASALVRLNATAFQAISADGVVAKGSVFTVAQLAGIMGAKQTSQLIPLCHNVPLDKVDVTLALEPSQQAVSVQATAKTQAYTGVEMEAMTAASVAALTVYDMCKALDKGITIEHVRLESKSGGKSGDYKR